MNEITKPQSAEEVRRFLMTLGRGLSREIFNESYTRYAELQRTAPKDGIDLVMDVSYGSHERHVLDVHSPAGSKGKKLPVVMFFHGGGFIAGHKNVKKGAFYGNVGNYFARHGIICCNGTYRYAPEAQWPEGARDIGRAVDWAREHIAEYGGDPEAIVVMGHSSGGTHVGTYALHKDVQPAEGTIKGAIIMSGQCRPDVENAPGDRASPYYGGDTSRFAAMSAIANMGPAKVPVYVILAEGDSLPFHKAGFDMGQALLARDGQAPWFRMIRGHGHMSEVLSINTEDESVGPDLVEFVNEVTGRTTPYCPLPLRGREVASFKNQPAHEGCERDPDSDDRNRARSTGRPRRQPRLGLLPQIFHHISRYEPHRQENGERHDDEIVEVSDDRNEIRDQVDRTQGISCRRDRQDFCKPWHARIARGKIQRQHIALYGPSPTFQIVEHGYVLSSAATTRLGAMAR
jgi:acetyl esterase